METSLRLKIPAKGIAADILDDEVVIVNLTTGHYFSTDGAGCEVWQLLAAGLPISEVIEAMTKRYGDASGDIASYVQSIAGTIVETGLMIPDEDAQDRPPQSASEILEPVPVDRTFRASPFLGFDDMESLLLLDPVHDADGKGWPHAAPGI